MSFPEKEFREVFSADPIFEAIRSRRSVRGYKPTRVAEEQVQTLLNAAIHAPSAMNSQPWAFLVIQRPDLLKRISDSAKRAILGSPEWKANPEHGHIPLEDPKFDIFYGATTVVVICMRDEEGFSPLGDCYLAAQNLMLAAHAMGLSTCPIGFARDVLKSDILRKELGIPKGYTPVLPIAIGYGSMTMQPTERKAAEILNWLH